MAPVHPAWEGNTIWVMTGASSVKVRNIDHQPEVAMHWQVDQSGDGVEVWGTATVHSDLETKKRMWAGVFDYDLNDFAPGGPDASPETVFVAVTPNRALSLIAYGMGGRDTWAA